MFRFVYVFRMIIFLLAGISSATAAAFPRGCEVTGFSYQRQFLVLNEKGEQTFYLIQNHSDKTIELERYETREVFMSPSLASKLAPSNWSAFASDIESFYFKCAVIDEEQSTTVNCADVLDICQYPRVKFALSNMGNYWVSTNKNQAQVIKDAVAKGILLRW